MAEEYKKPKMNESGGATRPAQISGRNRARQVDDYVSEAAGNVKPPPAKDQHDEVKEKDIVRR